MLQRFVTLKDNCTSRDYELFCTTSMYLCGTRFETCAFSGYFSFAFTAF